MKRPFRESDFSGKRLFGKRLAEIIQNVTRIIKAVYQVYLVVTSNHLNRYLSKTLSLNWYNLTTTLLTFLAYMY